MPSTSFGSGGVWADVFDVFRRRFATAAANGSWKDLRLLIERAGSKLKPRHIFPIFFGNLDPAGIPSVDQLDSDSAAYSPPCIPLIITSMQTMTETRNQILDASTTTELCADFWPRVSRIYANSPSQRYTASTCRPSYSDPETAAQINATPGVLSVLARAWKILLRPQSRLSEPSFHDLCRLMLSGWNAGEPENLAALMDALFFQHLYRVQPAREYPMSDATVFFLRGVIKMLKEAGQSDGPLAPALLAVGIIKPLTTLLWKRWLTEALAAGLLRAIVVCVESGFQETHDDVKRLLKVLLPPFLFSHSLLFALDAAFGQIGPLAIMSASVFEAAELYPVWKEFSELANQRIALMKKYDSGIFASLKVRACDNIACLRPGLRNEAEFKQCSGCMVSVYCSQACQTADWRQGHRDICEAIQAELLREPDPLSSRDKSFLRALVNSEFQEMKDQILLQQIYSTHSGPGSPLATLHLSYAKGPLQIGVLPTQDCRSKSREWGNIARASRIRSAAPVIVSVAVGLSAHSRYFLMRPFSSTLRDGLQRLVGEIPEGSDIEVCPTLVEKVKALVAAEQDEVLITV
ncbi:hypothetical protein FB451DRAFT_1367108 [Mycena latifolia]|nr:hypothetical protein FB451DRAFT_1367108 [Mycena latifolia]